MCIQLLIGFSNKVAVNAPMSSPASQEKKPSVIRIRSSVQGFWTRFSAHPLTAKHADPLGTDCQALYKQALTDYWSVTYHHFSLHILCFGNSVSLMAQGFPFLWALPYLILSVQWFSLTFVCLLSYIIQTVLLSWNYSSLQEALLSWFLPPV